MNPLRAVDRRATALDDWVGTRPARMAAVGIPIAALVVITAVVILGLVAVFAEPLFVKPVVCPGDGVAIEYADRVVCEDP